MNKLGIPILILLFFVFMAGYYHLKPFGPNPSKSIIEWDQSSSPRLLEKTFTKYSDKKTDNQSLDSSAFQPLQNTECSGKGMCQDTHLQKKQLKQAQNIKIQFKNGEISKRQFREAAHKLLNEQDEKLIEFGIDMLKNLPIQKTSLERLIIHTHGTQNSSLVSHTLSELNRYIDSRRPEEQQLALEYISLLIRSGGWVSSKLTATYSLEFMSPSNIPFFEDLLRKVPKSSPSYLRLQQNIDEFYVLSE